MGPLSQPISVSAAGRGKHSAWHKRFYCSACFSSFMLEVLDKLRAVDKRGLFEFPVTDAIAAVSATVVHVFFRASALDLKCRLGVYTNF